MSNRAIDRFRPQLRSKSGSHPQGQSTQGSTDGSASTTAPAASSVASESAAIAPAHATHSPISADRDTAPDARSLPSPPSESDPSSNLMAAEMPMAETAIADADPSDSQSVPVPPLTPAQRRAAIATHTKRQLLKGARSIGVPLVWIGVAAFCGGTAYAAYNWLFTIPPFPECDRLWLFSSDADKLFCAEQQVQSGSAKGLQSGIALVENWKTNHQLAPKASKLHQEWSKRLLDVANQKALNNDLDGAIELANHLQPGNPVHPKAKTMVLAWQQWRDRQDQIADAVESALQAQNWKQAEAALALPPAQVSEAQRVRVNQLQERIVAERMAFNQLQQVRELVSSESSASPTVLGRAIQLLAQIHPNRYVNSAAQQERQRWSQQLMQQAETQLAQGNINAAIAIARWLPTDLTLPPSIHALLAVDRAQRPVPTAVTEAEVMQTLWQHSVTLSALQAVPPDSPLAAAAQTQRSRLQARVQDLTQLSLAIGVANAAQIPSLRSAIKLAQGIAPGRPHRLEAQTLIAHWQKEIERIQDRPYLVRAHQLAKSGTIKDLQAAIAEASKIKLNRALRAESQAAIFDWKQKIQTIEDQPTLDKAKQLAQQQKLPEAIQVAETIAPDRALYEPAQDLIRTWTQIIQTNQDRPILDEAKQLAAQGNFRTAIAVAYQIAPGRALYNEAQQAIAQWTAQLPKSRRSTDWEDGGTTRDRWGEDTTWQGDLPYADTPPADTRYE